MAANQDQRSSLSPTAKGCSPASRLRNVPLFRWIDQHFKDVMVGLIASVAVLTGVIAYLETWAGNHYAADIRQGQVLAMDALGYDTSSRQQGTYDAYLYNTWNEWDWRRLRAEGSDPEQTARATEITELIAPLTPLLDENQPYFDPESQLTDRYSYHVDTNLITTTMLLEERAFTIKAARVWNGKSDGFVTILTVLAVSLFLLGLASTLWGGLRYLFAGVGLLLVAVALIATLNLALSPVPSIPTEAIAHYAQGLGATYLADYEGATEAYDAALEAEPEYGSAYYERAEAYLALGKPAPAVEDYLQALKYGRDQASTYWEMGWAYYLLGDYASSAEASYRALELDPHLVPVVMNAAAALLTDGQHEAAMSEFNRGLSMAADPASPVPADWNQLYLREAVNDLDRLIAALDGRTGFYLEPDLSQVQDHAALEAAAQDVRRYIKENSVAIQVGRYPITERTEASLSPIAFARSTGRNGELLGEGDTFARGELSVVASVPFAGLPQGAIVSRRVTRLWTDEPGLAEALPTMGQNMLWNGAPQGTWQDVLEAPWPGDRGFHYGRYIVEYYVDGQLLQSGTFRIPEEGTPIISPIVFATKCASGGVPEGQASQFPAWADEVSGLVFYSGLPAGGTMRAEWYRDGVLVHNDQLTNETDWGSFCFTFGNVAPGAYRLDLQVEDQLLAPQSATFEVQEIDDYMQATGERPGDWRFQFDLGNALTRVGDPAAADRYRKATELEPQCAPCHQRWWALLAGQGHYEEAVEKILQAIELNPKEYTYLVDLGQTYYALGDEASAIEAFRQALPANPAFAYNAWGNALFNLERFEEAALKYQQSIELNPSDEVVHANLGSAYKETGDYDRAITSFEQSIALVPSYALAHNAWGDALYDQELYPGAATRYQQAIELDPGNALYHSNLGWALYQAGNYAEAGSAFELAVELDPQSASDHNQWGEALYYQGLYAEAIPKFQRAIELDANQSLYHANLAWAYRQTGANENAAASFQRAVELDPSFAEDWNMLGVVLYELGEYEQAAEKHLRATELSPDTALYHYNLAWAYYQMGELEQAIAGFERAAELAAQAGDEELRLEAEDVLQQIR